MKHLTSILAIALIATTTSALAGLHLGDSIVDTDIKMKNVDGKEISIAELNAEAGTLVIFTCNHCPFALGWQQEMVAIGNAYQQKGIGVIFINSNDPSVKGDTFEGMQALAQKENYTFPYTVDATSEIAKHFGAAKTPDVFLFDAAGKLVYQGAVGEGGRRPKEGGETWLRNALDELLAGKKISNSKTKAVGCSIKWR